MAFHINDVKIDGTYIADLHEDWVRIAKISHSQARALLEQAGKFGKDSDKEDKYLFLNKGFVILPSTDRFEQDIMAISCHDGRYYLYRDKNSF